MPRSAVRTFDKVTDRCPNCGSRRPKQLVEGPQRLNGCSYLLAIGLTCGLALPFFFLFVSRGLQAWCDECDTAFDVSDR